MFKVILNGVYVPGVVSYNVARDFACEAHVDNEIPVAVMDAETGEIVFMIEDCGDCWEIYENDPMQNEVTEYFIMEINF